MIEGSRPASLLTVVPCLSPLCFARGGPGEGMAWGSPSPRLALGIQADGSAHRQGQTSHLPAVVSEAESRLSSHKVLSFLLLEFLFGPVFDNVSARSFRPHLWGFASGEKLAVQAAMAAGVTYVPSQPVLWSAPHGVHWPGT